MHETKACPIFVTNFQDSIDDYDYDDGDDGFFQWSNGSQSTEFKQGNEYSQSRRVFLNSYQFSVERKGVKKKMRRLVKEMNEAVMGALVVIGKEVGKRRLGVRVFRVRVSMASQLVIVKCFMPWFRKMK